MQPTRLRILLMLVLAVTSSSLLVWHFTSATPAPTRNSVCEPGGCATSSSQCTDDVFLDGTTPVDHPLNGGSSTVGAAGQDFNTFLTTIMANNKNFCFEPGTYVIKSTNTFTNMVGLTWTGTPGATIFQQANSINVNKAMFRFTGTSTSQVLIQGITFDFNQAGQGAYTCPNAGWILQIDPNSGGVLPPPSSRITIQNNEFKNSTCQAIEWLGADGIITGNYFHDMHEALFLTSIATQRVVVSNNVITGIVDTNGGANNVAGIDLEDRAQNMTISNNVIQGKGVGNGIAFEPANMTTVTSNTICCFQIGIIIAGPGAVGSVFNTVTANVVTNCAFDGIKVNHSAEQGTVITDNTLRDNGGGATDATQIFVQSSGPDILIGYNSLIDTRSGAARTQFGIYVVSTNQVDVIANVIDGFRSQGIRIENANHNTVTENIVISSGVTGLLVTGTSANVLVANNNFLQSAASSLNTVTSNTYRSNLGLNPIGKVTNFINGVFIGVCGTGTTVVSTTIYVVCGTDITMTCSGGTVTAIAEKDNLGNQIFSVANCAALPVQGLFVPIGYSITWTHTGAPTVLIYAN